MPPVSNPAKLPADDRLERARKYNEQGDYLFDRKLYYWAMLKYLRGLWLLVRAMSCVVLL
jgi:hypothetical protein